MKQLLLILFVLLRLNGFGQSIARNEKDKLSGVRIVETEWELLTKNAGINYYYRIRVLDNHPIFEFRLQVFFANLWTISKGDPLVLKLDNDTILTMAALETSISSGMSKEIGLLGYDVANSFSRYDLTSEIINAMIGHELVMFKMATSEGFIEEQLSKKEKLRPSNTLKLLWPRGMDRELNSQ